MDELDITSAESQATYEEIEKYVAEHYDGMKVSILYITQVKAKYGIIERENYNKPKSDDARQPKCPKEKEEAIVDALRYFQMIQNGFMFKIKATCNFTGGFNLKQYLSETYTDSDSTRSGMHADTCRQWTIKYIRVRKCIF